MSAELVTPQPPSQAAPLPPSLLAQKLVGVTADRVTVAARRRDVINGYIFWGLVALFIGLPELLAAFSKTMKADIPWPTISNLVGKDLEAHHHWIALLVVGLIVVVTVHTLSHPDEKKALGRTLRASGDDVTRRDWARRYIPLVAAAGIVAGVVASAAGADKNQLGYVIYLTVAVLGIVVPSALAYWAHNVFDLPTLFATLAFLRDHAAWVAAAVVALLIVLLFHLALYPWPNYHFGAP